ncbi:MAG: cyclic pyranopterin monophosphate synthase MoaC [Candidatus Marinimicrobia bacterium]|nr:cyclic pyranopterin monophosphate synthase MoaC [Candidatus Neomarinimicrobiota bacterium]
MTLSHLDKDGKASMVDVSDKETTVRTATAVGEVKLNEEAFIEIIKDKNKKGDVLTVANIAGINAAKRTSEIIPLTHQINLSHINIEFKLDEEQKLVKITATSKAKDSTGVEMEALTAVTVSALTIYDMCKSVDRTIEISNVKLIFKSGGKSGIFENE